MSPLRPTRDRPPQIRVTVADTAGLAASDIGLFVDNKPKPFSYDPQSGTLSYTSSRLAFGKHTVRIEATDAHQGTAEISWSFKVVR